VTQFDFGSTEMKLARGARRDENLTHRDLSGQSELASCLGAMYFYDGFGSAGQSTNDALGRRGDGTHETVQPRTNVHTLGHPVDYALVYE
jgi:hypothetical protein